jgi:aryl-alcohol dehydrogenase-like predicted oxidoreductase
MQYRQLGDAGIKLSEIGLGGWLTFGSALERDAARAVIDAAFEAGINFLDTANAYAAGKCEEAWGELLADRRRSSYVLATKVFFPMGDGPNDRGLSRKHVFEQCHASLRRLRTDYIDLYQCHRYEVKGIADAVPVEETVRAMDDLIRRGKVLYWGFSEWPIERIEECLQVCGDRYYKPKSSQPQYSAIARGPEKALFPLSAKAGIGQVVFSPLAQGVLTGKYKPGQPPPADSRAMDERQNRFIKNLVENQRLLEKVQRLAPLAQERGITMSQLALAWILRRPEVTSCIIGATRPQQVKENAAASGIKLDEGTVRRVEEILA